MRRIVLLGCLTISLNGFAQTALVSEPAPTKRIEGNPSGVISGIIKTTDGGPAAFVSVMLKEAGRTVFTDEQGVFLFLNLKEGRYTLEVSMVGLKPQQKSVELKKDETAIVNIALEENTKQLEAVIITNSKINNTRPVSFGKAGLSPLNNPQATGLVPQAVIRDQQAMRLGDIVKNVSGVSLTQQRQGVAETFSARGYSIGIGGGTGSIFKNGIVTNTGGFPEASTLESVEVLKGSSALLYGNTSAGVIINMVTKKPRFDWGGSVSMNAGSYDLYKPVVDVYGPLSKSIAFRVVGTYEKSNSFRDVVHTDRKYINPSLLFKLGKKTTLLVQGDYLDADFTPDNGIGILNQNIDPVIPASRSRFINTSWAWYHSKTASASVELNHNFNDAWKLNVIAGGQSVDINSFGTAVPNAIAANGDWVRTLSRAGSLETNQTAQANLTGKFKTGAINHQVLIGTDYVGIKTTTNAYRITNAAGVIGTAYDKINILNPSLYTPRTDEPATLDTGKTVAPNYRLGYYAQDLVSLTSKLKMLVGLRYSYLETKPSRIYNYIRNKDSVGTGLISKAFSPKAALIYQPTQDMAISASYANSFTTNTGVDVYNNALKPSFINDYEIGFKNLLFNGRIAANLSLYRIINSNLAQTAITLADGTANTNTNIKELTGETASDGFDADFSGSLSKDFYFIAGYGYNYARYTHSSGAKGAIVEGEKLNNSPEHTANASLFYTFSKTAVRGLKLGASAFYTGNRFGGNQNAVGQTPQYNRQVPLNGFATVDVSAGYLYRKVSLLLKLSNLTNTLNYYVHDRYSVNPIAPRQLIATASYKF